MLKSKEKNKVAKKDESKNKVRKILLEDFVESYNETKGAHNTRAAGFKAWWVLTEKKEIGERLLLEKWVEHYKKFINMEVK